MFKKVSGEAYPPRQWALVGYPGCGKSTFAMQMKGPVLVVDCDHRVSEAVRATGATNVFALSDDPADNMDARKVAEILKRDMPGSGVKTIVVDSLTALLTPLVVEAVQANDAGENTNRVAAFKPKALAMRTLQHSVTAYGCDTLWIYHTRDTRDAKAQATTTTSVSAVELARLRSSLNIMLSVVQQGKMFGIKVDWARNGRSGMTIWDHSGNWNNMPNKVEYEVYEGLTAEEKERIANATPTGFSGPEDAIAWGFEQGAFRDSLHAKNAYDKLKEARRPQLAQTMWDIWIADVQRRKDEAATDLENFRDGDPDRQLDAVLSGS